MLNGSEGVVALKAATKFNIADFAPAAETKPKAIKKSNKKNATAAEDDSDLDEEVLRLREEERAEKERAAKLRKLKQEQNAHRLQETLVEKEIKELMEQLSRSSPKGSSKKDSKNSRKGSQASSKHSKYSRVSRQSKQSKAHHEERKIVNENSIRN